VKPAHFTCTNLSHNQQTMHAAFESCWHLQFLMQHTSIMEN